MARICNMIFPRELEYRSSYIQKKVKKSQTNSNIFKIDGKIFNLNERENDTKCQV